MGQASIRLALSLSGPMGPVLKWLEEFDVCDLQNEPDGLLALYRQIHGREQLTHGREQLAHDRKQLS